MKYIKRFSTNAEYQEFKDGTDLIKPNICSIEELINITPIVYNQYTLFPVYLVTGDNGSLGIEVYNYLSKHYPSGYGDLTSDEEIYVNGNLKQYLTYNYRLTDGGDSFELKPDGSITFHIHSGGDN